MKDTTQKIDHETFKVLLDEQVRRTKQGKRPSFKSLLAEAVKNTFGKKK